MSTYNIVVWVEFVMVQDEASPDIEGQIELTDSHRRSLDDRLAALVMEGFVDEYSLEPVGAPTMVTEGQVVATIKSCYATADQPDIDAIWKGA